jgi:hypothetical protein
MSENLFQGSTMTEITGTFTESVTGVDLHSRESRIRLAHMVMRIFKLWGLSPTDKAKLLGFSEISRSPLAHYRKGNPLPDSDDLIGRIGHFFSIYESLNLLFPHNLELAHQWVKQRSASLNNRSALEVMKEEGYEGILAIRHYLDYQSHQ